MPELQLVAFLDSQRRVGVAHIVRLRPTPIWKGETWCGRLGEPVPGEVDRKLLVCKTCQRRWEGSGG